MALSCPPTDRMPLPDEVVAVDQNDGEDDFEGQVLKRGFLTKQGKLMKTWRRRLFILKSGGRLTYYNVRNRAKLAGELNLKECTAILPGGKCANIKWFAGANRSCCFALCTAKRTLFLYSDSEEETREWLKAFREVCPKDIPLCTPEDIRASWTGMAVQSSAPAPAAADPARMRVSVFRNGMPDKGKVVPLPATMDALRSSAAAVLGMPLPTRIFLANGAEISSIALIRDDDMLYCSDGADFTLGHSMFAASAEDVLSDYDEDEEMDGLDSYSEPDYAAPSFPNRPPLAASSSAAAANVVYEEPPDVVGLPPPSAGYSEPPALPAPRGAPAVVGQPPSSMRGDYSVPPDQRSLSVSSDYQEPVQPVGKPKYKQVTRREEADSALDEDTYVEAGQLVSLQYDEGDSSSSEDLELAGPDAEEEDFYGDDGDEAYVDADRLRAVNSKDDDDDAAYVSVHRQASSPHDEQDDGSLL